MRCIVRISLGLLGLALAAVPTAALADLCPACQARAVSAKPTFSKHAFPARRLCASCAKAQMAANGGVLPPPGPPMVFTNTPGVPGGQVCTTCQPAGPSTAMAPGYAVAGGQFATLDPAPIGVVQTNYQHPASGSVAMPPGRAVVGSAIAASPSGPAFASPNILAPAEPNRPRVISNLLPRGHGTSHRASRKEQARSDHAAIPYGNYAPPVNELPASVVYGK